VKILEVTSQAIKILNSGLKFLDIVSLDVVILLSHSLSCSKEEIIFNPNFELNLQQQKNFFELIERRKKREPIAQIIGRKEFFGEDFLVNKYVLTPRPDSETLIELILKNFPDRNQKLEILEVGVGSGCLIITLLKYYPNWLGIGLDISQNAINICQNNIKKHFISKRLQLVKSDLFSALNNHQEFDLIISNPPYIEKGEIENLSPEVKIYEPIIALDGGEDGLDFYRRIAFSAAKFLKDNGRIILEIGYGQKERVIEIFNKKNLIFINSKSDLSGIERVLEFKK
jgi:release factor glutamine methyltransferase